MSFVRSIGLVLGLLRARPWALPVTIVLGLLASLAEGIGLSLFIPLLQSLNPSENAQPMPEHLASFFQRLMAGLPEANPLPYIAGLILGLTLAKGVTRFVYSWVAGRLNAQVTHELRSRIFRGLLRSDQETRDRIGTGRLVTLLANDTWQTSDAIALVSSLLINICSVVVFSLLLMTLSWKLSVLVMLGILGVSTVLHWITVRARTWGGEGVNANAALSEKMIDSIEGVGEIQAYGLEEHMQRAFDRVSALVRAIYFRLGLMHSAVGPISESLYVSLILGVLLVGVTSVASVPTVMVFLLVLYRLQPQIREMDSARLGLASLESSVSAVTGFLADDSRRCDDASHNAAISQPELIAFEDISFTYPGERQPAVTNISFHIPAGKITAIVGRSGSGKSTIVGLLARMWEPSGGRILWNGVPSLHIDPPAWRQHIAWVDQHAHLFNATVLENIRYGRLDATDSELATAAREACADEFIADLPRGYATRLGTGGTQLSSGQAQRIALARAFLRKPSVVILDEATNGLDSLSEGCIQLQLRSLAQRSAVVIVSHRMPSVRFADHVIVVEDGRLVDSGAPEELRSRWGYFSRVYELQHAG